MVSGCLNCARVLSVLCQAESCGLAQVCPVEVSMPFGLAALILALVGPKLLTMAHPQDQPQGPVEGQEQKMIYLMPMSCSYFMQNLHSLEFGQFMLRFPNQFTI